MITIPREICRELDKALTREWLVTNGRGSYASSTITCMNTRRYHGLLVAALKPPLGRTVLLAKLDEEVELEGHTYKLGTNEYPHGTIDPDGFLFLQDAEVDGLIPSFRYTSANFNLCKTVWMEHGRDTTYVRYELESDSLPITLTLLPLCTYRDFHSQTKGSHDWSFLVEAVERGFRITAFEGARPYRILATGDATFTPVGLWYWNLQHRVEAERGLGSSEDLYLPGLLRTRVEPGQSFSIIVTLEPDETLDWDTEAALVRTHARQRKLDSSQVDEFSRQLFLAADQFVVARPRAETELAKAANTLQVSASSTVIAGYHWFGDWGRDTMISLDGLTLVTRRFEVAREILLTYSQYISEGMLPNRFPDYGEQPEYNTVDATLWYFHAIYRYVTESGDRELLRALFPTLREIVEWHVKGTRYNIRVDAADGLIAQGEPGVQLTWMDAKVGDWVVTPRTGKPVEINALWYNALRLLESWAKELREPAFQFRNMADRVAGSFERFWFEAGGYLYDVIDGPDGDDVSLRPNQLLALSLAHSAVPRAHAKAMLDIIERELLTPYGLRSLTPRDPKYRGTFAGDRNARDAAYHNGTVWPWLMGAYLDARRRVYPGDPPARQVFEPFKEHLAHAGLGTISECFEGDSPHRPVACIAQAWSVAEVLRAYCISLA